MGGFKHTHFFSTTYTEILDKFQKLELSTYNLDSLKDLSIAECCNLIDKLSTNIKSSNMIENKNNYKLCYYQVLIDFMVKVIIQYMNDDSFQKINYINFLSLLSRVNQGHV